MTVIPKFFQSTRKKLLEIARKNAVYLMKNDCLPAGVQNESLKITGKSVNELTGTYPNIRCTETVVT